MQTTTLGNNGPRVSRLGFGVMQMAMKKPHNDQESIAAIQAGLDAGINLSMSQIFMVWGEANIWLARQLKGAGIRRFSV